MTSQILHTPPPRKVYSFQMSWAIIALWWKQTKFPAIEQGLLSIALRSDPAVYPSKGK